MEEDRISILENDVSILKQQIDLIIEEIKENEIKKHVNLI